MYWKTKDIAETLLITTRRVNQLVKDGVIPKPDKKGHKPKKAISAFIKNLNAKNKGTTLEQERVRLTRVQIEKVELELAEIKGEIVSADEVRDVAFKRARILRDNLMNVPSKLGSLLAAHARSIYSRIPCGIFS